MTTNQRALLCWLMISAFAADALSAHEPAAAQAPELRRVADAFEGHVHPAICVTKGGDLLIAHYAEKAARIHLARSTDGGRTWKDAGKVADIGGGQPYPGALNTLKDGRLLLTWNFWLDPKDYNKGRRPYFATSADDGRTWTPPRKLPVELAEPGYVRHAIWERSPNEWIFPMGDRVVSYDPAADKAVPFGDPKLITGPLVQTKTGTLLHAGQRSTDAGKTWKPIAQCFRMNAYNCDMIALTNGWVVAVEPNSKNSFRLIASFDDGQTWTLKRPWVISDGERLLFHACHLAQVDADHVGVACWDVNPKQTNGIGVYFVRLRLDELRERTAGDKGQR